MNPIFEYIPDRFALGGGLYIGSWGIHLYLDLGPITIGFEFHRHQGGDK